MNIKDTIKETLVKKLEEVSIDMLPLYSAWNRKDIDALYANGFIDDASIEQALEKAVFKQANRDYQLVIGSRDNPPRYPPDHLPMPEVLLYAIEKGKFTKKELSKIAFDHGDTLYSFTKTYRKDNLLIELREAFLKAQPPMEDFAVCCCPDANCI